MITSTKRVRFKTRRPAVAGLFYPADAEQLKDDIERTLQNAHSHGISGEIKGLISPHAGYMYSGYVAAEAYKQLDSPYEVVVVISPSHRDYFKGISVYPGNYATPLGEVPVDLELIDQLVESVPMVQASELGHREEHGVEVELPFLQLKLPEFHLIPLVMASQDWHTSFVLGNALGELLKKKNALIVASSDLSHFYSVKIANQLDGVVVKDVEEFDEEKFSHDIQIRKCEACGAGPILATMIAAKKLGSNRAKVLSYHTSGEISGDYNEVVGYLSGVMHHLSPEDHS